MEQSRYGKTGVKNEYLRYPFNSPVAYDVNYSGTYSKYSLVDKFYVDSLIKSTKRLINGGAEFSDTNLSFTHNDLLYSFSSEILSISANSTPILLSPADTNYPRIDLIVINEGGLVSVNTGIPSATPEKPILREDQILLQYAYVDYNSTKIKKELIYHDGDDGWNPTSYQISGSINGTWSSKSTQNPHGGPGDFCLSVNADYTTGIKFTKQIGDIKFIDYGSICLRVRLGSVLHTNKSLISYLSGTSNLISGTVSSNIISLNSYGLDNSSTDWQHIIIPISKFGNEVENIKSLSFRMIGGNDLNNWFLDSIYLQSGLPYDEYMVEPDHLDNNSGGTGTIGTAGDGDYTDGLFTDLTNTTSIGDVIDRMNEALKNILPATAPPLTDWSIFRSSNGVNGKLSFDKTNTISSSTYIGADINGASSPIIPVDGQWVIDGKRLGIYPKTNVTPITGTLSINAAGDITTPTPAYSENSFGDANKGTLELYVNGSLVSSINLTNRSSQDTTSYNTLSGLSVSTATASKFPMGAPYELFQNRTGTWRVNGDDSNIVNGYNYIYIQHKNLPQFNRVLSRVEFIIDDDTTPTGFTGSVVTSLLSGSKYLSGINYYTGGSIKYDTQISNLYRNTYYSGTDAITFNDISATSSLIIQSTYSLPNCSGNEAKNLVLSTDLGGGSALTFSVIPSGLRIIDDSILINTTAKRSIQGTITGGVGSLDNVFFDNVTAISSNLNEYFDTESWRLKSNNNYNSFSQISTNTWGSTYSLIEQIEPGYNDGLQIVGGQLTYPTIDFSVIGTSSTNLNFGVTMSNYSQLSGNKTYIRWFRQTSPTAANFSMIINGHDSVFVSKLTSLTGNNVWVEMKVPGNLSTETGWMDCYDDFQTNQWSDGMGCRSESIGFGRSLATKWGLTIGTKNTVNSDGYILLKITVGPLYNGYINSIKFTFNS
jgi:hypothetical protein